jgi:uncharacterized protein (DUF1778 family)
MRKKGVKTEQVSFRCPVELKKAIEDAGAKEYRTITSMMLMIMREWAKKRG